MLLHRRPRRPPSPCVFPARRVLRAWHQQPATTLVTPLARFTTVAPEPDTSCDPVPRLNTPAKLERHPDPRRVRLRVHRPRSASSWAFCWFRSRKLSTSTRGGYRFAEPMTGASSPVPLTMASDGSPVANAGCCWSGTRPCQRSGACRRSARRPQISTPLASSLPTPARRRSSAVRCGCGDGCGPAMGAAGMVGPKPSAVMPGGHQMQRAPCPRSPWPGPLRPVTCPVSSCRCPPCRPAGGGTRGTSRPGGSPPPSPA